MLSDSRPRRQYRQVADQILQLAAARGLGAGQRLPSERDLAELLSVSRPSLREALIALEVEGHVEIRMGSGIYLGSGTDRVLLRADAEGPLELLEARCILEGAIAEEVARHVTPELLRRLDDNLRQMAAAMDDTPLAIGIDGAFHEIVASGLDNSVLSGLSAQMFQKRHSPFFARFASFFERPLTWSEALAEHGRVRDALAARDPAAARDAMRHHLTQSRRRFTETVLVERAEGAALQES
ncbi:MAG: FadR family transcriptional regulator [Paracoccus sp.]|nr:FadR family transcriptional regulator [Paracoccus sp. (in: a-proteobacteria)]